MRPVPGRTWGLCGWGGAEPFSTPCSRCILRCNPLQPNKRPVSADDAFIQLAKRTLHVLLTSCRNAPRPARAINDMLSSVKSLLLCSSTATVGHRPITDLKCRIPCSPAYTSNVSPCINFLRIVKAAGSEETNFLLCCCFVCRELCIESSTLRRRVLESPSV